MNNDEKALIKNMLLNLDYPFEYAPKERLICELKIIRTFLLNIIKGEEEYEDQCERL